MSRYDRTPKQRAIDVLKELIVIVEHDGPPPPEHICGAESPCDSSCADFAAYAEVLDEARWLIAFLQKPPMGPINDLEVPGQKVDQYARTPSALRRDADV